MRTREKIWALVTTAFCLSITFWVHPPPVDDAYITFRYAANFYAGHGLVYNVGENALGLTTPFWAMLLVAARWLGLDFEFTAIAIGIVSLATLSFITYRYCIQILGAPLALFIIPLIILNFQTLAGAFSGMEALPYTVCVIASFWYLRERRIVVASLLAATCLLFRPDGMVVCFLVLGQVLYVTPKKLLSGALIMVLTTLPWFLYASSLYGTVIPHSLEAKRIIHYGDWLTNGSTVLRAFFAQDIAHFLLAALGLIGLIHLWQREPRNLIPLWVMLYLAGLIFSGVQPIFYWYFTPLWVVFLVCGIPEVLRLLPQRNIALTFALPGLVILVTTSSLLRASHPDEAMQRDVAYRQIGVEFADRIAPHESVYLCETGILGYSFLSNRVIDASGINSKEVLDQRREIFERMRREQKEAESMSRVSDWSVQLVKQYKPDWIISPRYYCQLAIMEDEIGWFRDEYERVGLYLPEHLGGIGVYRRRK